MNAAGHNGVFNGNPSAIIPHLEDAGATIAVSVVGTIIIAFVVKLICGGLRVAEEDEEMGLDVTDHGEIGYSTDTVGVPVSVGSH